MRRYLLLNIFICLISLSAWTQPRITSNKETHNFGQIEWKKPATVEYTINNTGNQPLVLTNVTASCACAVSKWTKKPIKPGEKGTVTVVFDGKALGRFNKSIAIYSNASPNLVYLHFNGEVVRKVTDFTNTNLDYATIGDILIDKKELDFPDINRGEAPEVTIHVVNRSDQPYEPVLMHLPSYMSMRTEPSVLQKGEKGTIKLKLDSDRLPDLGLIQTSVYLSRFAGDKVSEENEIPVSAILLPDFSSTSDREKANPPVINLSQKDIDVSKELGKKSMVRHDVTITNTGESQLKISKLQVFNPGIGVELNNTFLSKGEKARLRLTVQKKDIDKKKPLRVLMITNDPKQPKVTINIQASAKKQK